MNSPGPGEPPESECVDQVARAAAAAYHASMDKRVAVLEMRFDSVLPTLATKVDIAELRSEVAVGNEKLRVDMARMSADLREEMNQMHRKLIMWIVSTMIAMFVAMVGLFVGITSAMIDASLTQHHAAQPVQQAAPGISPPR